MTMAAIDLNTDLGENVARPDRRRRRARCSRSSRAPTSPAASTPAAPRASARRSPAPWPNGVTIGAHPGYRDYEGFGRRDMDVDSATLQAPRRVPARRADRPGRARSAAPSRYVKPHGALYNTIARDERQATDVVAAIRRSTRPSCCWVSRAASCSTSPSARASRSPPRPSPTAPTRPTASSSRAPSRAPCCTIPTPSPAACCGSPREGVLEAIDGTDVRCTRRSRSACTATAPGAVAMAAATRGSLEAAGITIAPFAGRLT